MNFLLTGLRSAWPLLLFVLYVAGGSAIALGETQDLPTLPPTVEEGGSRPEEALPSKTAEEHSRLTGWFNRSGAGLFIALTPFATTVAIAVILLLTLIAILMRVSYKRKRQGYFRTIPYARQRR